MIKKAFCLVLAILFTLILASCSFLNMDMGKDVIGFEDEDEAIEYFVEKMTSGDIEGALKACPFDMMAEKFDYEEFVDMLGAVLPISRQNSSEYEIGKRANRLRLEQYVLDQISTIIFKLNADGEFENVLMGMGVSARDLDVDDIMDCFDPTVLEDLELEGITKTDNMKSDNFQKNMDKQAEVYGADDKTYRTVIYKFKGDYYEGGFELIQYDDLWYVVGLLNPFAFSRGSDVIFPLTDDQAEELLD